METVLPVSVNFSFTRNNFVCTGTPAAPLGAIVGGVVGGVAALIVITVMVVLILVVLKKKGM